MKIKFREIRISRTNLERLNIINSIIEEYQKEGYVLTLRQLYYQLVSRDVIPNKQAEYGKLSNLLKEGRMAGIVDWGAIEDRLRVPSKPSSWESPEEIMAGVINQYKVPRQKGQPEYLEVWVEKDALSGVLKRVTEEYHVPIMVNRGYSSASAMFDAYKRFINNTVEREIPATVLYLGDFDPSGLDMIRDIGDRIREFQDGDPDGWWAAEMNFQVIPIALTKQQIDEYNPPPNPAKVTDPRAKDFITEHGRTSWEVDALRPEVLNSLLRTEIESRMDMDIYYNMIDIEKDHIDKLKKLKGQL